MSLQDTTLHSHSEHSESSRQEPDSPRRLWTSIFAVGILSFLGVLLETGINVLFPPLMREFGIGTGTVQWMTSAYLLMVSVVMPLSGYLQRRFPARLLFIAAAVLVAGGLLVAAVAQSYPLVLAGRVVQAIGTGIATPLMFTIILTQAPRPKVGLLMGVGGLVLGSAPALGPVVGGIVGSIGNWRIIFWAGIPLVLIALILGIWSIRQTTPTAKEHLSAAQLILLAVGMVGIVLGVQRGGELLSAATGTGLWPWVLAIAESVVGLAGLAGFAAVAHRSATPLIHLSILRSPAYALGLAAYCLLQFSNIGLSYVLPNAAQLGFGSPALLAGLVSLPGAVTGAVLAPVGGTVLDRVGARIPTLGGIGIALVGAAFLVACGTRFGVVGLAIGFFTFSVGFGLAFSNVQTHAMRHVTRVFTADGTALMNTAQQFSGSLSVVVLSAIIAVYQSGLKAGAPVYRSATVDGVWTTLIVVAVLALVAFLAQWRSLSRGGSLR